MDQNLSQYRIFYAVARAGNISKAAKELYISQPAISKSISKLEDSLNTTLFIRNSRGVRLTEEGRILYDHTKSAFEQLTAGERELQRIREFHLGQIRIGVSNTLCRFVMVDYLKEFIARYPHIKISIASQSTIHTISMLEKNQIDIGLVAKPRPQRGMSFLPVMDIEDIFAATPSYLENLRLREGKDCDVFQVGNIMLLDQNNGTRKYIDDYMNINHITANNLLEVTTLDLLIEFTRIGLGIGSVIREFVPDDLADGRLVQLPLDIPIHKRTIGFAWQSDRSSRALETFIRFCKEQKPACAAAPAPPPP